MNMSARRLAAGAASKLRTSKAGGGVAATAARAFATVPGPRLFDYAAVTGALKQSDAVEAIESAFGMLAKGKVDVPIPMHIGIDESDKAGPGDCHIKGGYIYGTTTWTVKLANVSFYKNLEKVCFMRSRQRGSLCVTLMMSTVVHVAALNASCLFLSTES